MKTEMERKKHRIGYYIQPNRGRWKQTETDSGDRHHAKLGVELKSAGDEV